MSKPTKKTTKKASPAQLAARNNFKQMVADRAAKKQAKGKGNK